MSHPFTGSEISGLIKKKNKATEVKQYYYVPSRLMNELKCINQRTQDIAHNKGYRYLHRPVWWPCHPPVE